MQEVFIGREKELADLEELYLQEISTIRTVWSKTCRKDDSSE